MYYQKQLMVAKGNVDKIYLYKNGDECTAITGGWSITGANIFKEAGRIRLAAASQTGRQITTVNPIDITTRDRIGIVLMTTAAASNTFFRPFKTTTQLAANYWLNNIYSGRTGLRQDFCPTNAVFQVSLYDLADYNEILSLTNNFGVWYIYEIFIEKYDF